MEQKVPTSRKLVLVEKRVLRVCETRYKFQESAEISEAVLRTISETKSYKENSNKKVNTSRKIRKLQKEH